MTRDSAIHGWHQMNAIQASLPIDGDNVESAHANANSGTGDGITRQSSNDVEQVREFSRREESVKTVPSLPVLPERSSSTIWSHAASSGAGWGVLIS